MFLKHEDNNYKYYSLETRSELIEILRNYKNCILLGEDSEVEINFKLIDIQLNISFGIGIISERSFIDPSFILLNDNKTIVIGFNKEINIIDILKNKISTKINLGTNFNSLIKKNDFILILFETGVMSITETGIENWKVDRDVVVDYNLSDYYLELQFMDDNPLKISIKDGKIL